MSPWPSLATAVLVAAAAGSCSPEPVASRLEWRGHHLREVGSLAAIPAAIRAGLGSDRPGIEGVAERGRPFNVTDVVDDRLPMRRFLTAGSDGETWLVALEHGGRGYRVEVFLFSTREPAAPEPKWVLPDRPRTLADVIRMIPGDR
jgi:hypothetical protein